MSGAPDRDTIYRTGADADALLPNMGRYRWYVLFVLALAQSCHALDRSVIGLVLEPVKREFGLSDQQAGLLAGFSYGVAFAIAAIPFGMVVDRFNRRNLLSIVLSIWSGFTLICGLANSYVALLLARSAVGAAEAGGSPTGMSLMTDYFRPAERASAVGLWYASSGVGTLGAFMAGGFIAQHYGWRAAFIAAGAPGLIIALLVFLTVREPVRGGLDPVRAPIPEGETAPRLSLPARLLLIARTPGLPHCMIGLVLVAVASSAIIAWLTAFLMRIHHLQLATAGTVVAICIGLASSLGVALLGLFVDGLNRRRGFSAARSGLFAAGITAITAVLGAISFLAASTVVSIVFLILMGVFIAAYNGPANGLIITISDSRVRGLSVAVVQFWANLVGFGLGPLIVGTVTEGLGGGVMLRWGLVAILAFYLWGSLHFLLAARRLMKR
ncbi:MAG: transporter [Rhizorhabdus sp.]|nr:transporter [Rhizorhabdus sp.]